MISSIQFNLVQFSQVQPSSAHLSTVQHSSVELALLDDTRSFFKHSQFIISLIVTDSTKINRPGHNIRMS